MYITPIRFGALAFTMLAAAAFDCAAAGVSSAAATPSRVLIMSATGDPDPAAVPGYLPNVESYYINPVAGCSASNACDYVPVTTPEQFAPIPGFGDLTYDESTAAGVQDLATALSDQTSSQPGPIAIFGYSQSAGIATTVKRKLADGELTVPDSSQLTFILIGNVNRPNGGILERFAGLHLPFGLTFDGATPTDTQYQTTDIAFQYDALADFPQYPINLLADANAIAGFYYVHDTYPSPWEDHPDGLPDGLTPAELDDALHDPANQQHIPGQDTTYITIPTKNLPLLQPIRDLAAATGTSGFVSPIVDFVQPVLRVMIDTGYDRSIPFGQPEPAGLIPPINPVKLVSDLAAAVAQGAHAALSDLGARDTPSVSVSRITRPASSVAAASQSVSSQSRSSEFHSLTTPPKTNENESADTRTASHDLPHGTTIDHDKGQSASPTSTTAIHHPDHDTTRHESPARPSGLHVHPSSSHDDKPHRHH